MTATHTPGPWLYAHREGDDGMFNTQVFSPDGSLGVIATCAWVPHRLGNGVTGTYREANSRLIAAAPDLLAALKLTRGQWIHSVNAATCLAAIAKATGEAP